MNLNSAALKSMDTEKTHTQDQESASSSDEDTGKVDSGDTESDGTSTDDGDRQHGEAWSDSDSSVATSSPVEPEEEQLLFPAVLPTSSVMLMAESKGCVLPGHAALALGQLAMNKLRHVVMVANQLRKHDHSYGVGVDHFSQAEKMLDCQSFGHKSSLPVPKFKSTEKCVITLDDSDQNIDLVGSVAYAREHPSPLQRITKVTLSETWLNGTTLIPAIKGTSKNSSIAQGNANVHFPSSNSYKQMSSKESILRGAVSTARLETLVEKILVLNEEEEEESSDVKNLESGFVVGVEWIDYMKVFIISFFSRHSNFEPITATNTNIKEAAADQSFDHQRPGKSIRSDRRNPNDFKLIIEDITSNSILPVLRIILNFFNDYMEQKFGDVDSEGLRRIISLIRGTLACPVQVGQIYLHQIFKTLTTMISLTPAMELHQSIAQTFILLMKKSSSDFSMELKVWTCSYVTETLNWCLTSCLHNFSSKLSIFNLSVSLANALEEFGTHVSLDLRWHTMVVEFVQGMHYIQAEEECQRGNPAAEELMDVDPSHSTSLEKDESVDLENVNRNVMIFCRFLFKNYEKENSAAEAVRQIHAFACEEYGEKMVPFLADLEHPLFKFSRTKRKPSNARYFRCKPLQDLLPRS